MNSLLREAGRHIKGGRQGPARETYSKLMEKYSRLDSGKKSRIYPKTDKLYNDIKILHLRETIERINEHINGKENTLAKNKYKSMQEIYRSLSPSHKKEIADESMRLYRKISGLK